MVRGPWHKPGASLASRRAERRLYERVRRPLLGWCWRLVRTLTAVPKTIRPPPRRPTGPHHEGRQTPTTQADRPPPRRSTGPHREAERRSTGRAPRVARCAARDPARRASARPAARARRACPAPAASRPPAVRRPSATHPEATHPEASRPAAPAARARGCGRAPEPHERKLELRERLADRGGLLGRGLLDDRHQRADRLDRDPNLLQIALVVGAGSQSRTAHAEVDQRYHVLEQDLIDADLLELGLVGGPQLLFGRRTGRPGWIAFGMTCAHDVTSAVFPRPQNRCPASRSGLTRRSPPGSSRSRASAAGAGRR